MNKEQIRKEFEKLNPCPAYYYYLGGSYEQAYKITEKQWHESVKYHNDWLLWNQAWQAAEEQNKAASMDYAINIALLRNANKKLEASLYEAKQRIKELVYDCEDMPIDFRS